MCVTGSGSHQINVSGFSIPSPASAFVNVNEPFIQHGVLHVIRVSPGQMFKAMLNSNAILLPSRTDPYMINDPTFRLGGTTVEDSFVNVTDKYVIVASEARAYVRYPIRV